MKFWESPIIKILDWKEEPKGVAKVMSVCMLIVIVAAFFTYKYSRNKIGINNYLGFNNYIYYAFSIRDHKKVFINI